MNANSRRYSLCSDKNGAEAVLWAIENRMPPDIYNIADYYDYNLYDILKAVKRIEGRKFHLQIPNLIPIILLNSLDIFSFKSPLPELNFHNYLLVLK